MTNLEKAKRGWEGLVPDWVTALALACDETSQRKAAERLGYSPGAVNAVINGKWPASTAAIEHVVRGAFMAATVICPVQGEIGMDVCRRNQALPFAPTNHMRVQLYRACREGCHHAAQGAGN